MFLTFISCFHVSEWVMFGRVLLPRCGLNSRGLEGTHRGHVCDTHELLRQNVSCLECWGVGVSKAKGAKKAGSVFRFWFLGCVGAFLQDFLWKKIFFGAIGL